MTTPKTVCVFLCVSLLMGIFWGEFHILGNQEVNMRFEGSFNGQGQENGNEVKEYINATLPIFLFSLLF